MKSVIIFVMVLTLSGALRAQDAQWRGPERNGIYPDTALLKEWPEEGPGILFVADGIGKGFSSAVATVQMIYVTGIKDSI